MLYFVVVDVVKNKQTIKIHKLYNATKTYWNVIRRHDIGGRGG